MIPAMIGLCASRQRSLSSVLKNQAMVAARKKAAISTSARTGSAMLQEVAAGALDVLPDLVGELERGAELVLAPKQSVEVEAHRIAVDVRVEVENVALDRGRVIFVE